MRDPEGGSRRSAIRREVTGRLALATIVVLMAAAAPAHAGSSSDAAAPEGRAPGPTEEEAVREEMRRLQRMPGEGARHRLDLLATLTGVDPPDEADPHAGQGTMRVATDLTGDGLEDLVEDRPFQFMRTLAAVRGSDGATLWTFDYGGEDFLSGGVVMVHDLTGDGLDDLIVARYAGERTLHPLGHADRRTLTLWALRGADGVELWSRPFTGSLATAELEFDDLGCLVCVWTHLDFPVLWELPGDLDGDGAPDLLVRRQMESSSEVFVQRQMAWAGGAVFEAVSGRTGGRLAEFPAVTARQHDFGCFASCPDAVGVPDLTGDGRPDVVVLSVLSNPPFEGLLTAYPGTGGAPVWSTSYLGTDPPRFVGADLTGDGRGDILTVDGFRTWPTGSGTVRALSGADGSTLWLRELEAFSPGVALPGDATGNGGSEVLVAAPGLATLFVGATGAVVWEHPHQGFLSLVSDVTGDGVPEFLLRLGPFDQDVPWELRSGADTSLVWTLEATSVRDLGRDLDGDGTPDFLTIFRDSATGTDSALGVSGATGGPLWWDKQEDEAVAVDLEGRVLSGGASVLAADIREEGRPDLVVSLFAGSTGSTGVKTAYSGVDGALLWTRPPAAGG